MDRSQMLEAYRRMKTIREFDERMKREFEAGEVPGFIHLYCGQEAIAVGACLHLEDKDRIGSTHRGHGHCIAKGCAVEDMLLEIFCRADGLCKGKGGSMHIADMKKGMLGANAIVGASPPIVVGAALTAKTLGTGGVALAFIGDGASNQGTVFEAMNMASVLALPAIFLYENNGYAEFTGADYATGGGDIAARAGGFGMPSRRIDGTDLFAVHEAVGEAVARARRGEGPSAIEAVAKRWYGHYEGDPQLYRAKDEVKRLRETADPIVLFRERLIRDHDFDAATFEAIDAEVIAHIETHIKGAKAAPLPTDDALYADVYATY